METLQFNANVHTTVQSSAPLRGQALQDEGNKRQLTNMYEMYKRLPVQSIPSVPKTWRIKR